MKVLVTGGVGFIGGETLGKNGYGQYLLSLVRELQ